MEDTKQLLFNGFIDWDWTIGLEISRIGPVDWT